MSNAHPFTATDPAEISVRDEFLRQCAKIRDEVLNDPRNTNPKEKLDLMMFGLLVLIDGMNATGGPYGVIARDQETGRDYNISIDLHHHWHRF